VPERSEGGRGRGGLGAWIVKMRSAAESAPSAALRPGGRCSRLPHFVGEAKTDSLRFSVSPTVRWGRRGRTNVRSQRGQPGSQYREDEARREFRLAAQDRYFTDGDSRTNHSPGSRWEAEGGFRAVEMHGGPQMYLAEDGTWYEDEDAEGNPFGFPMEWENAQFMAASCIEQGAEVVGLDTTAGATTLHIGCQLGGQSRSDPGSAGRVDQ
jgi:hypothetical protein